MARRRRPARPGALADLAPSKILAQIVILQILYYAVAAALILFTAIVAGNKVTADLLLSWKSIRGDVTTGWMLGLCWMMDSLIWYSFQGMTLKGLAANNLQCHIPTPLHCPIKTCTRLRPHHSLHQPHRYLTLHESSPDRVLLVGSSNRQCFAHDSPRSLGLPMERAQAHLFRRQEQDPWRSRSCGRRSRVSFG